MDLYKQMSLVWYVKTVKTWDEAKGHLSDTSLLLRCHQNNGLNQAKVGEVMRRLCTECGRLDCHPNCPEADDMPEPTFTIWQVGNAVDTVLRSESAMRKAASKLGFDADVVMSEGEADILRDGLIVTGGCYINDYNEGWIYD